MNLGAAAVLSAALAGAGRAAGWLTARAALVAAALGWGVLVGSGLTGFALVGVFFVTGSLLAARAGDPAGRRPVQVAANGWTAAAGAGLVPLAPDTGWALLAGGLAAAQADTWATEIGLRAGANPVLLTTGAGVPPGTSGGVTAAGTAGGVAGAAVLGAVAAGLGLPGKVVIAAVAAGILGMLADSLLGATVQVAYRCARCGGRTDHRIHCDAPTFRMSGWRWVTNDVVNAAATGLAGGFAVLLTLILL